jgi:octaheme c-type cytochrome (tetrathionate reductase family)
MANNLKRAVLLLVWVLGACDQPEFGVDRPADKVSARTQTTDHSRLFQVDGFSDGPSVTRACLNCHPDAAAEVMRTSHWNWLGEPERLPGRDEPVRIGKRNLINNFCISIEGNWPRCTVCHAGYGWVDAEFDFRDPEGVDCLICHDQSGLYAKTEGGLPLPEVDLLAAARSVGPPGRDNCGWCHFNGGGGDAVKHGDLDGSLSKPVERIDVHMGGAGLQCIDCHKTERHDIPGRMISVSATGTIQLRCTDCHATAPHRIQRLNAHTDTLACQSCHIPEVARSEPTKIAWDWSTAGRDVPVDDPHSYLKIKGSFVYARNLVPEYYWFNGNLRRYLKGDKINPAGVTHINLPLGGIDDPSSRIWPFKVHRAKQPYDRRLQILIVPKTVGKGGYWTEFDWEQAARLGSAAAGLPFSGEVGFTETDMYWTMTHMVAPKEQALQCTACHAENGRLDWRALGYDGDPAFTGSRRHRRWVGAGIAGGSL